MFRNLTLFISFSLCLSHNASHQRLRRAPARRSPAACDCYVHFPPFAVFFLAISSVVSFIHFSSSFFASDSSSCLEYEVDENLISNLLSTSSITIRYFHVVAPDLKLLGISSRYTKREKLPSGCFFRGACAPKLFASFDRAVNPSAHKTPRISG
jgi:hypothetical protein